VYCRSAFSGAFKTGALYSIPTGSVIFNVFMNVATYMIFTALCFFLARPPAGLVATINRNVADSIFGQRLPRLLRKAITVRRLSRAQTVAVCFCGAAKTQSLGIPLIAAMWTHADPLTMAYIEIPVVLYTMEQVFLAQGLVYVFKWYLKRDKKEANPKTETAPAAAAAAAATADEADAIDLEATEVSTEMIAGKAVKIRVPR
jgi:sodium/bile acid cotransporter 7